MNNGNGPRILFALGAIFLSVLALTARGVGSMPKKDAWFTQHYIIMQDFERKAYRELSVDGRKAATPQAAGTQYREQLEDFNRNVTFGIVDLEKYKQDLSGLEKK